MKSMLKHHLLFGLLLLSLTVLGQNRPMLPYSIQKGTSNDHITNLRNLSRSQDADFKLIRKTNLEIIRKNVIDSISRYQEEIAAPTAYSSSSVNTVKTLRASVDQLATRMQSERQLTDGLTIFVIAFSKSSHQSIVLALIIVLAPAILAT